MKRAYCLGPIFIALSAAFGLPTLSHTAAADEYLSPGALAADREGRTLYVAECTAKRIDVIDVASRKSARTIALQDNPTGIVIAADGLTAYVTEAGADGKVQIVDTRTGKTAGVVDAGHTPLSPVLSPDGLLLYVCNRFMNSIGVIDTAAKKEVARIAVLREPVAAALVPDGSLLFVANLLPVGPSDGDVTAAAISVIDTAERKAVATIPLPNGSSDVHGVTMAPDGKYAYAVHLLSRYQLPTTQLERGWMNTNALSVIDVARRALVNTVLLDDVDLGAANPRAVACTPDGQHLCVTHAGTHEISVIDRAALHAKLDKVAAGEKVSEVSATPADVPNDLAFLVGLRRRIALAGNGPRAIAITGTTVFAAEYFSDSLSVVDLAAAERAKAETVALGPARKLSDVRKGEMFFNDAALCFQHWQSCASCHPDARVDGFNWDLLNDGIGNPKNTKNMLLAHKTPPAMSLGIREKAEVAVRAGIKFIQFAVRPEEDAVAIDQYLKSLKPVPSPYLVNGDLSPAARRGKPIFENAGCVQCHPAPLFTDKKAYDIGTGTGMDKDRPFDTPTLVEVWRTAPYLHDGRAATMADVLKQCNPGDKHGVTSQLTQEQLNDLAEFVLSL